MAAGCRTFALDDPGIALCRTTGLPASLVATTPGETSDLLTVLGMLLG
jgi:hypothetical protein